MRKLVLVCIMLYTLSGCVAFMPMKFAIDKYCRANPTIQNALQMEFEEGLEPYSLSVKCTP